MICFHEKLKLRKKCRFEKFKDAFVITLKFVKIMIEYFLPHFLLFAVTNHCNPLKGFISKIVPLNFT